MKLTREEENIKDFEIDPEMAHTGRLLILKGFCIFWV